MYLIDTQVQPWVTKDDHVTQVRQTQGGGNKVNTLGGRGRGVGRERGVCVWGGGGGA